MGSEPAVLRPEDELRFEVLYKQNCAGCHGANGMNGAAIDLANPEYQSLVDDASLTHWISKGMPQTQMPAFAISAGGILTDKQIEVLVQGMRQHWAQAATAQLQRPSYAGSQTGDATRGGTLFQTSCASCHKASKQEIASPDYLALVSDQALRSMIVAGRPDIGQPDWRNDRPGSALERSGRVGHRSIPGFITNLDSRPTISRTSRGSRMSTEIITPHAAN